MLELSATNSLECLALLKSSLAEMMPDVNSCHRVEGVARGLGYRTYAALRAGAVGDGMLRSTPAAWTDYMQAHGFPCEQLPLYVALGKVAIANVMRKYPSFTSHGVGVPSDNHRYIATAPSGSDREKFLGARSEMLESHFVLFLRAACSVQQASPMKTINRTIGSYGLKHIAEKMACHLPDGTAIGPDYVSNGALICAAVCSGFDVKTYDGSLNTCFNMSKKSIRDLDAEIRGRRRAYA